MAGLNEFNTNIVNFQDVLNGQNYQVFASGGVLYMGNIVVAPDVSGNLNTNDLMMITANLQSGATSQRIYYPLGYEPVVTPKVVYSIIGEDSPSIIASQLSQVNVDYFEVEFSRPIPGEQYYIQATIYKNDDYITFSGTNVDLNPIRTAKTLYVDTVYGHNGGTFSGRRQNPNFPFFSFQAAHDNATSGDRIYFYPGIYSGIDVNKSLFLEFAPGAYIDNLTLVINSGETTVKGLNINHKSGVLHNGISVKQNARLNLQGESFIRTNNRPSILTSGDVYNYGSLFHNGSIGNLYQNVDSTKTGYFVNPNFSGSQINISGFNNQFYINSLEEAINIASNKAIINVESGNYPSININKDLILNFAPGATISGRVGISGNKNVDVYNINIDISSTAVESAMMLNGVINFYGENKIKALNGVSISGSGLANCYGNVYYFGLPSPQIKFDKKQKLLVNEFDQKGFSGLNENVFFNSILSAIDFSTGNQEIKIGPGSYSGFSIGNKNLILSFDKNAIVTGSINLTGTNGICYFKNLYLDTKLNTGIGYGINIVRSGFSGWLDSESIIRLPYVLSNYFITGSGSSTGIHFIGSGALETTSVINFVPPSGGYYNYGISGNFDTNITGVLNQSGLAIKEPRYSVSGSGSIFYGNSIFNQVSFPSVLNLNGSVTNFNSGAPLFNPYGYIL